MTIHTCQCVLQRFIKDINSRHSSFPAMDQTSCETCLHVTSVFKLSLSCYFAPAPPEPSAPPQNVTARALSSHMIEVRWHPPASNHQNGDISGYRVMYAKERGGGGSVTQASVVRLHEGARSCILRTLEKWTQYQIWVLAYTHIGDGPRSDGIIARTDEDGM